MRLYTSGCMFARCTSPTQSGVLSLSKGGICWSLSVTMQAWDRGNAGGHSKSALPVLPPRPCDMDNSSAISFPTLSCPKLPLACCLLLKLIILICGLYRLFDQVAPQIHNIFPRAFCFQSFCNQAIIAL